MPEAGTSRCYQLCVSTQPPLRGTPGREGCWWFPKTQARGQAELQHHDDVVHTVSQMQHLLWWEQTARSRLLTASSWGASTTPQRCGLVMGEARSSVPPATGHIPLLSLLLREGSTPGPAVIKGSLSSSYSKLKYHIVFMRKMDYRLREKCVQLRRLYCKPPSLITEALCHQTRAGRVPWVPWAPDIQLYSPWVPSPACRSA